ncbi:MAG: hypothetical protein E7055_04530 [Lentisphaerae bacterium]|nr:hypothetical protein [Lentisphaerota bacterium]
MKKLLTLTAAALVSLLPVLQAQEAEEEAPNPDAPAKAAPAAGSKAKADKKAATDKEAAPASRFADQQKKIEKIREKLKTAQKTSERKKLNEELAKEQKELKNQLNHELKPLKKQIDQLKERVRLSSGASREKHQKELAEKEAEIKGIETEANLEKWTGTPELAKGAAPNPGSGKSVSKNKKGAKSNKSSKSKKSKSGRSKKKK